MIFRDLQTCSWLFFGYVTLIRVFNSTVLVFHRFWLSLGCLHCGLSYVCRGLMCVLGLGLRFLIILPSLHNMCRIPPLHGKHRFCCGRGRQLLATDRWDLIHLLTIRRTPVRGKIVTCAHTAGCVFAVCRLSADFIKTADTVMNSSPPPPPAVSACKQLQRPVSETNALKNSSLERKKTLDTGP